MPKKKFDYRIVFLVLLLASCGQENMQPVPVTAPLKIEGVTPVWEGSMLERSELVEVYNQTLACLSANFNYAHPNDFPHVVLSSTPFDVGSEKGRDGAIVDGVIYLNVGENFSLSGAFSEYILKIFSHEIVHWITGMTNQGHDTPPFLTCSALGQAPSLLMCSELGE